LVDTIYIEHQLLDNKRAKAILSRYAKATVIAIDKYTEVFNSHGQNFRVQKNKPAMILAEKNNQRVFSAPSEYQTGGGENYYFSHMLNCLYDCRYCFLQGMYRSANYLLFVNYQDFVDDIKLLVNQHIADDRPPWFFSWYDCDSLALEPITGFADYFLDAFEQVEHGVLELRTKSTQVRGLLDRRPQHNVVVAYSLSPDPVARALEIGAPSLEKRLDAIEKLQNAGWRVGIRFDPIVWNKDYQEQYRAAFGAVFERLDCDKIDSVTVGGFRLPKDFFKKMRRLYPEHWIFYAGLSEQQSLVAYKQEIEEEVLGFAEQQLQSFVDKSKLFLYPSYS
jgi:spore photoproduct lyase